jgi:hypothetical protein
MGEAPLEGIETLMRAKGYSVGHQTGFRVVGGSFEIDGHGTFHVHAVTIVSKPGAACPARATTPTKKVMS